MLGTGVEGCVGRTPAAALDLLRATVVAIYVKPVQVNLATDSFCLILEWRCRAQEFRTGMESAPSVTSVARDTCRDHDLLGNDSKISIEEEGGLSSSFDV